MDAAPAGDRKHRSQAERGQHLAAGRARGVFVYADCSATDLTLDEIVAAMHKRRIAGSRSAVWRYLQRHKISVKKKSAGGSTQRRWRGSGGDWLTKPRGG
jgi:transposase